MRWLGRVQMDHDAEICVFLMWMVRVTRRYQCAKTRRHHEMASIAPLFAMMAMIHAMANAVAITSSCLGIVPTLTAHPP